MTLRVDYVEDWRSVFKEFYRVLVHGGYLVFSSDHPLLKYQKDPETSEYFSTERSEYVWTGLGLPVSVPYYSRSPSSFINPLMDAGFFFDRILEPKPTEEFKKKAPGAYLGLCKRPAFICVRARKLWYHRGCSPAEVVRNQ